MTEGDNLAFLDQSSGKEWLDLTQTQGRTLLEVSAEFGAGGIYEGFRLAILVENNENYSADVFAPVGLGAACFVLAGLSGFRRKE